MDKVIHIISSLRRGGRERQLTTLYKNSKSKGTQIRIICFNKSSNDYLDDAELAYDIYYLKNRNPIKRYLEMKKIVASEKANIIWTWGGFEASFGLALSLFTDVKHVNGSIRHGIVRINRKQLWRMFILHLSKYRVANSYAGLRANLLKKGFVWYNGIDDSFFAPPTQSATKVAAKFDNKDKAIVFISIANLVPYKDYETIIKALATLRNDGISFYYLIIGDGPRRVQIEDFIRMYDLSENILILGHRKDIRELLHGADIFIHSSRGEGCSNAILEAMACGLPIVATNTGGTAEVVKDKFGYLYPFRDSNKLYSILKYLLGHPQEVEKLGNNAKLHAFNHFSLSRMVNNYEDIIKQISSNKHFFTLG